MNNRRFCSFRKQMGKGLIASVVVCCLLLITTMTAWAKVGKIFDQAGVLDQYQVTSAGASLYYPVDIYTTTQIIGTKPVFMQRARTHLTPNSLVIAINTKQLYIAIVAGKNVPLTDAGATIATTDFKQAYHQSGKNFTAGTVSSLHTLTRLLPAPTNPSQGTVPVAQSGKMLSPLFCIIGFVVLGAIVLLVIMRRRATGFPVSQPQYNLPYAGPPQQGGMNPLAAGGLGAAAGGLVGYELGKMVGEREAREDQVYSDPYNDPNQYGGGNAADLGNDDGGNYGGGNVADF